MFTTVMKQEEPRTRELTNKQEDKSSVHKCRDSNNFCKLTYAFMRFFDLECAKKLSCLFAHLKFGLPDDVVPLRGSRVLSTSRQKQIINRKASA